MVVIGISTICNVILIYSHYDEFLKEVDLFTIHSNILSPYTNYLNLAYSFNYTNDYYLSLDNNKTEPFNVLIEEEFTKLYTGYTKDY